MARLSADQPWYWWHRYQHLYLWVLYTFVHLRYLYSDVQRLAFGKNDGLSARYPKGADMAWLLGGKAFFLTVAFVMPLMRHELGRVAGVYLLVSMTMGLIFSVVFQLAHSVDVVEHPRRDALDQRPSGSCIRSQTTANFATGSRLATFLLGGLNHQREHHLFPRIAHVHYPALVADGARGVRRARRAVPRERHAVERRCDRTTASSARWASSRPERERGRVVRQTASRAAARTPLSAADGRVPVASAGLAK